MTTKTNQNQNIYELMLEEWDSYEENWIIKMQQVGLIKPDLSEKEHDQLFKFITYDSMDGEVFEPY